MVAVLMNVFQEADPMAAADGRLVAVVFVVILFGFLAIVWFTGGGDPPQE